MSNVIVSSDPVRIDVTLQAGTRKGLDLLRRVEHFAAEMRDVGLEVEVEGNLTISIRAAAKPQPDPEPAP